MQVVGIVQGLAQVGDGLMAVQHLAVLAGELVLGDESGHARVPFLGNVKLWRVDSRRDAGRIVFACRGSPSFLMVILELPKAAIF